MSVATSITSAPSTVNDAAHVAPPQRVHALDALRGVAMLLGVALHAAVSYMQGRVPELLWPLFDSTQSVWFDAFFWWLHAFRLPLFFLIAGFFSRLVRESHGSRGYLRHRTQRLLVPALAIGAIVLPITMYVSCFGWLLSGQCTIRDVLRLRFSPALQPNVIGPAHLWFLLDLYVISVVYWAYTALVPPRHAGPHPVSNWLWSSRFKGLWLALPSAALLYYDASPYVMHDNTFHLHVWRIVYYGSYFSVGVWLYGYRHCLGELARGATFNVACSLLAFGGLWHVLPQYLATPDDASLTPLLALSLAGVAWFSIWGYLGWFMRWFDRPSPALRYLADASYWIYLIHLPIVALVQIRLYHLACPALVKFLTAIGVTVGLGLVTYQRYVRYTFIGGWLHGTRKRPTAELIAASGS